jgi:hypothetical protein
MLPAARDSLAVAANEWQLRATGTRSHDVALLALTRQYTGGEACSGPVPMADPACPTCTHAGTLLPAQGEVFSTRGGTRRMYELAAVLDGFKAPGIFSVSRA